MKRKLEHHVGIIVNNFAKMQHFYQELLGFSFVDNGRRQCTEAAMALNLPKVDYHIYRAYAPSNDFFIQMLVFASPTIPKTITKNQTNCIGFNHIGILVDDIYKVYQNLKSSDIKIITSPVILTETGTKIFYCYDPDGNMIELFELKN
jgi:catechol 2,3-dioxygenase-like lactoylglutathione lyase family enzyme